MQQAAPFSKFQNRIVDRGVYGFRMLEARNLTKRYSAIAAVEKVSFTILPGQILGYLGPNGSGDARRPDRTL